jgi:hypothetical protein
MSAKKTVAKKATVKKNKTLIIDRKTWAHGGEVGGQIGESGLLNYYGFKCCLGFAAEQICHASKKEIMSMIDPSDVPKIFNRGLSWLLDGDNNSGIAYQLMFINDKTTITDKSREGKIKRIFAKHDITVKFIN